MQAADTVHVCHDNYWVGVITQILILQESEAGQWTGHNNLSGGVRIKTQVCGYGDPAYHSDSNLCLCFLRNKRL